MRSMTGFGRGVAEQGDVRVVVDLRAVNHRFLDLKLRGATLPAAVEDATLGKLRGALERGSVTAGVHVARAGGATRTRLDVAAAERVHNELHLLAGKLGLPAPDLGLVIAQPGVVVSDAPVDGDDDAVAAAVRAALDAALDQLAQMRRTEGDALAVELRARLDELVAARAQIAGLAGELPRQLARKLGERLQRLLDGHEVDPGRLAQEVAVLADRADITEELVRLASHLDQAHALIAGPGAIGRRLDFLIQEIGRELNTIGSKSASAEITSVVVGAKATLEKLREQVQNVE